MKPTLLDTDVLSEVLKQRSPVVNQHAAAYLNEHQSFTFSEFTWFEVERGLLEKNALQQIEYFVTFTEHCNVQPLNRKTFNKAAELWSKARQTGKPHSDADILIAPPPWYIISL